jgi:hypothetical protein
MFIRAACFGELVYLALTMPAGSPASEFAASWATTP